jgi:PAS domain S-box-containing protein
MKPDIHPTSVEVQVPRGVFIVSKTDLTGRITYVNRTFMQVANYTEAELLGKQHNIIRHPDMPRGVFKLLWDTLKKGDEFFGFVKNLAADGSYYWVFANITPDLDAGGKLTGYYSVRRRPNRDAIAVVEPIYREMLAAERRAGPARAMDESIALLQAKLKAGDTSYEDFVLKLYRPE